MTEVRSLRHAARLLAAGLSFAMACMAIGPIQAADRFPDNANRVVTIGGSLTEIVYALGEQDRLVARDSTSSYPQEALKLPDVGYMRALSPEGVLSAKPDAILALEGSGPPETVSVLAAAGIPFVTVAEKHSGDGILEKVRAIGEALGVEEKAEALSKEISADLAAAVREAEQLNRKTRILFILSFVDGRIQAAGRDTGANGIIGMVGAQNAISGYAGYKQLNEEAIVSAAPDVILMIDRTGTHNTPAEQVLSHPAIAQTPAGQHKRLIKMDGLYLLGFGPRTANAVRDLSKELAGFGL